MRDELGILRFLGLASKAGKVISGYDQVEACLNKGNAKLLIISTDISKNTLSRILDIAERLDDRMPPAYSFSTKFELGRAIGRPDRALVAVTDTGFADRLSALLQMED